MSKEIKEEQWRLITPDTARILLKHSRQDPDKIHRSRVKKYAEALKRGEWDCEKSDKPIDIRSEEGYKEQMSNGNHRMKAVIEANKTMWWKVKKTYFIK